MGQPSMWGAKMHAVLLVAFLVFGGRAQAQFKGVAEPMPAMPVAPIAAPVITAPALDFQRHPSLQPQVSSPLWVLQPRRRPLLRPTLRRRCQRRRGP